MQAKEDGDKPGLEAMLQKVLQLYASRVLSKRSYARKGVVMHVFSYKASILVCQQFRFMIMFVVFSFVNLIIICI